MYLTPSVRRLIELALEEDIGRGDLTSFAVLYSASQAVAEVVVKQDAVVAGLPVVDAVFQAVDPNIRFTPKVFDGERVLGRTCVGHVQGPAQTLLAAERTALNFLARLSGIATLTAHAVAQLAGTSTKLLDTRKTTPGWRWLEKYAVRVGGAMNHRFGLDDMVLIKDNHIAVAGGIREAVARARQSVPLSTRVEVEVDTLEQLEEALTCDVDLILLDNMDCATLAEAVRITNGRVPLEASGNLTPQRLRDVALTGVNYVSMGALTHSAVSVDVGLDIAVNPRV
ncbi:nicotinate-nucleotide diphosphorylase (carboxylating) [Alicyclobacillus contaminans]|uniref:carboxylating nicotinate-nucleotide diphosphorylase n=1 Tax=Alicyclobacillus contaminans TaxID=392016 RepID=UPI00040A2F55|nr:carboxylating nicotinate-nucleotide diphosphorylase [Alicyclobacillus contaminans]GMA49734.1 nicotinate-nucleotide diphosphorylase (carboxylating) [Alicyclobacillus contaminans]